MPVILLERLPLPSLRTYTVFSVLMLSTALFYAHSVIEELEEEQERNATDLLKIYNDSIINIKEPIVIQENNMTEADMAFRELSYSLKMVTILFEDPRCVWALVNMAYCCLILVGKVIQKLVFGELRVSEQQHLKDKFWNFVFYKFIFIFGVMNVQRIEEVVGWCAWFSVLGFLHLLAQLCKDRFEYLSFSATTPTSVHVKVFALLFAIQAMCGSLLLTCAFLGYYYMGANIFAFMAAEVLLLGIKTLYVIVRYGIHLYDLNREGVWENRTTYSYYTEIGFELVALSVDFLHHLHMLVWGNIFLSMASLVICMQLRYLFHEFQRRIRRHKNFQRVVSSMEARFPMATMQEIESNNDECAICWEKMDTARKLPCNHLFHKEMEEFLQKLGVDVTKLKEEHIGADVVPLLDDAELKKYVPKYGDRVMLRRFLQSPPNHTATTDNQQKKSGLMEKLRSKLRSSYSEKEKTDDDDSSRKKPRCSNAIKENIRIELGWMHYNEKQHSYTQVRSRYGGGTRNVNIKKSATKRDLIEEAKSVFFPDGKSPKGLMKEMKCDLSDFKLDVVDENITIESIITTTKMYKVRFYLTTRPEKECEDSNDELPDLQPSKTSTLKSSSGKPFDPKQTEADSQVIERTTVDQTKQTNLTMTIPRVDTTSDQVDQSNEGDAQQTIETSNMQIIPEPINPPEIDYGLLMMDREGHSSYVEVLATNDTSEVIDIDISSIMADDAFVSSITTLSNSEVQFGPLAYIDSRMTTDDTIPLEYVEHSEPVQCLHVHRGHVLDDFIKVASQDTFSTKVKYELKIIGTNGEEEAGEDNGGVLRDALTEFWDTFFMKYCVGTNAKVPVIRHDMSASMWKGIAKVIIIGWNQENVFPVQLAKPFIHQCLFGSVHHTCDLVASFLQYLPSMDNSVITEALNDYSADEDDLMDVLERLKVKQRATKENIRRILEEVSHRELVQAPMFICDSWNSIMNETEIDPERLDQLYRELVPTNRKVLKALTFPEHLSRPEMDLREFVNDFIRELEPEMIKLFMRFCTGSDMMVKTNIAVRFTSSDLQDGVRCPTSHTCGCVVEIPRSYAKDSYVVFKSDFKSILQSRYWQIDVV